MSAVTDKTLNLCSKYEMFKASIIVILQFRPEVRFIFQKINTSTSTFDCDNVLIVIQMLVVCRI